MKQPQFVDAIYLSPRNSNNDVSPGDTYELFYYDKKWISAGRVTALLNTVTFPNIPSNTLYWLRNLDRGKEEQAFIYVNDRQIFINEANYINNSWIPFEDCVRDIFRK